DSITACLDDALRLLEHPQALYDALPERLKVLLMQALFERIWVVDKHVVGGTVIPLVAQLLAVDRQEGAHVPARDEASGEEYHRLRQSEPGLPAEWEKSWCQSDATRTIIGSGARQNKPPGLAVGHGLKIEDLVGSVGYNLNSHLKHFLEKHPDYAQVRSHQISHYPSPKRQRHFLKDRLAEESITSLIDAFRSGVSQRRLAKRYGVDRHSIRKLLVERRVQKEKLRSA